MRIIILIILGVAGGVVGGMGMGGGTLLIPLLRIFTPLSQHVAQSVNLISFIPMAIIAIAIHFKNKLIDVKSAALMALPAVITAVISGLIADRISGETLKTCFGIFLLALGGYQLTSAIIKRVTKKR